MPNTLADLVNRRRLIAQGTAMSLNILLRFDRRVWITEIRISLVVSFQRRIW
jgi:hypothetical protein